MENNVTYTLNYGERVTSLYAEIYLDGNTCELKKQATNGEAKQILKRKSNTEIQIDKSEWTSPSDLLIEIIDLAPPFTSKITRGKTHEGILAIGNDILEKERERFLKHLTTLINDTDAAWNQILQQEKAAVESNIQKIYHNIFFNKSKTMKAEIATFYEENLQEIENHLRLELQKVLISTRASIISHLNTEIKQKLSKEKNIIERVLQKKYESEVFKIKKYYKLLLQNEIYRKNQLINHTETERNDALKAFCKQVDADNITSTMYVMCTERKKCKVKKFMLENYQDNEVKEKLKKIKERQDILDILAKREITLNEINNEWQDKIKKILQLFLKFISFSLKLLPEQTTFLLDFQKMVVLQLNEIHKMPRKCSSILISEEKIENGFKFQEPETVKSACDIEPFVVIGDMSDIPPPKYGSRETLPSEVDLPTIRLQRQFLYAKCHNFEQIKDLLEKERCKCTNITTKDFISDSVTNETSEQTEEDVCVECESSNELLIVEDIHRLHECPVRACKDWAKSLSFPYLEEYLDFTEENFERVKILLGKQSKGKMTSNLINPKSIAYSELLFGQTNELYHNAETQYSSQEELSNINIKCPCVDINTSKFNDDTEGSTSKVVHNLCQEIEKPTRIFDKIILKRQMSLKRLLHENPNLHKMFTEESFCLE